MTKTSAEQPDGKRGGGPPLKYETVEELDRAIKAYFDKQDPHIEQRMIEVGKTEKGEAIFELREVMSEQKPYTITGLALAIGLTRQGLLNYKKRDEFIDSIELAKQRCGAYAESQLFGPYANGAKFALANNYNDEYRPWAERHNIDHTTKDKPIPLLAGIAPDTLEVEDDDATADDSTQED